MGNTRSSEDKCIFCKICRKEHPDSKNILAENEKLAIFSDINPAAKHHYLVVPKQHINNPKTLNTKEHMEIIKEMVSFGKDYLQKQNDVEEKDTKIGFHWPPFISIEHLHLHIICPASSMSLLHRAMFNNSYMVDPEYVIDRIESKIESQL
ncbi:adenosine 5'-monophosphoramidase HINT3-like [Styela clava]